MCRILSFFRTLQVLYVISQIRTREGEYEDSDSVIYEYEPDYECGSIISEASYIGDQQKTLMEVLSYCQVFLFLLPSHGIETILGKLQEDLKSVFDKLGLQPFQLFTCWLSHNCCIFNEKNNLSLYSELLTP